MNRVEKASLQLRAVEILRMLKSRRTYEELAVETGLPASDLNRYVNGHVLPGVDRAQSVVEDVGLEALAREVEARITRDADGYIDNTELVFDQQLLDLVAPVAIGDAGITDVDVVLTAATDGITLAAATARHLDARAVYAKKSRETAVEEFIEARQRVTPGIELTYSLPASALDPGERALVVDDIIRSGETQGLLLDIAEQAGAEVAGVFALIAVGEDGLVDTRQRIDGSVDVLVTLDE